MASYRLVIVCNSGGSGCKVIPGSRVVTGGDDVTWSAIDTDAILFFPDVQLFGQQQIALVKGTTSNPMFVKRTAKLGSNPYAVYCNDRNCFCVGGSEPEMIVQ